MELDTIETQDLTLEASAVVEQKEVQIDYEGYTTCGSYNL